MRKYLFNKKYTILGSIFVTTYALLGFSMWIIFELTHGRNPYLNGYLDVVWGRADSPYFSIEHLFETLSFQFATMLIGALFGAILFFVYIKHRWLLLRALTLLSGITFSTLYFLDNSNLINPGSSYGGGNTLDLIIGISASIFSVLSLFYLLSNALIEKKHGSKKLQYRFSYIVAILTAFSIGWFSLAGFGYLGYGVVVLLLVVYLLTIFIYTVLLLRTK